MASTGAAGFDLCANIKEPVVLAPFTDRDSKPTLIGTGLRVAIPFAACGLVMLRSSMGKHLILL